MIEKGKTMAGKIIPVFVIASAFIGFNVGASNSTGQEALQFVAGYGLKGLLGVTIMLALFASTVLLAGRDAQKYHLTSIPEVFEHYAGPVIGKGLTIYTSVLLIGNMVILIAGSGAVFEEYLGLPALTGRIVMTFGSILLAVFGLKQVTRVGGAISTLIIGGMVIIPIVNLIHPSDGFAAGSQIMQSLDIIRASDNWFIAAIMYYSWGVLLAVAYVATLGSGHAGVTRKQVFEGVALGNFIYLFVLALPNVAMIANASVVGNSQIPNIALANRIHPVVGSILSIIVVCAIFTTMVPETYAVCNLIQDESSKWFRPLVVGVVLIAFVGSGVGSFAKIVNVLASVSAWVGYIYVAAFLYTKLFRKIPLPEENLQEENREREVSLI